MDLYVYDKAFNLLGLIDDYESLVWTRNFYKSGTFELNVILPVKDEEVARYLSLMKRGNIIVKDDNPSEAALIQTIIITGTKSERIKVSGIFLGGLLSRRIVWGQQEYDGTIESVMKSFVTANCITPTNPNRVIPNLITASNIGINVPAQEIALDVQLDEYFEELATKYDVGWRVLFDDENNRYVFDVYRGLDLSVEQSANPQAIFSLEYENVNNQTLTDSESGYKNMAVVTGAGELYERKTVLVNDNLAGFTRYELYVNGSSVRNEREDGSEISPAEYEAMLAERGRLELSTAYRIFTLESDINVFSNLVYRQDFDLGDIVTIENNRWGVLLNARITSVEETYAKNLMDVRVSFGNNVPTLLEKIKKAVKK